MLNKGKVLRSKVLETIKMSVLRIKVVRPTYLSSYEEALVVASTNKEVLHGFPIDVNTLGVKLQLVIIAVNARQSTKVITHKESSQYTRLVIKRVKNIEDGHDNQRKKSRTVLVNVSSISNIRPKQSDPRLAWMMFHKIAQMYRYIKEQENDEATEMILNLRANLNSNNTTLSSPITPKISIQQLTMPLDLKTVPKYLKEIQPHPYQVCNCDEIGFDPNGLWLRVVYTYKLFTGKRNWKPQK